MLTPHKAWLILGGRLVFGDRAQIAARQVLERSAELCALQDRVSAETEGLNRLMSWKAEKLGDEVESRHGLLIVARGAKRRRRKR